MDKYSKVISDSFTGYANYLWNEIIHPSWHNYFYYLIAVSLLVLVLEVVVPWRKNQSLFRKGFWQDAFYMFFNFFLFSLVAYNAISNVFVELFKDFLAIFGVTNMVAVQVGTWASWQQFLLMFLLADFIQWAIHVMLHKVNWMWEFHKVHHSVEEMGFAAHLRFHPMETIIYKSILYIPLTMIGFGIKDFYLLYAFTILIGHLNHANIQWNYGFLRYIFNNPHMHIWHHAKYMPASHPNGINFGISLSIWDYIFGTAHVPNSSEDIPLGFDEIEEYPTSFWGQMKEPFKRS